ncbi:hypothetical protein D9O36_01840 [Zobellia amurskyensis]|uniref:Uncharacterized protein n=1 Tax=Zobellia amurskyensis TaxID=248905 RepID=A0A7X2ZQK8_9FLAO|nr:hypothetical protein [Zobellia amurskyensis]MUH34570.1 hypothetical protein [Zobellia amurskyensis]
MKRREICSYCGGDFTPTRRGAQKFCSNSCRSRNWQSKQRDKNKNQALTKLNNEGLQIPKTTTGEKMSLAGVGNAATGVAVVELAKTILTSAENKPATKRDIQELKTLIKSQYLPIKNLGKDATGRTPYYDVLTGNLVYLFSPVVHGKR